MNFSQFMGLFELFGENKGGGADQVLTFKIDILTERIKIFIMAVGS